MPPRRAPVSRAKPSRTLKCSRWPRSSKNLETGSSPGQSATPFEFNSKGFLLRCVEDALDIESPETAACGRCQSIAFSQKFP